MVLMLWWNMLGIPSLIRIVIDRGNVFDELLLKRMDFTQQLLEIKQMEAKDWTDPEVVKVAFKDHFANHFNQPGQGRFKLNFLFPNRLSNDQVVDLDRCISYDEIRGAVWNYVVNKSPGSDGFTFEFFKRYWSFIGPDFCSAIDCFLESGNFPMGSNASFIALIPEVTDAKSVTNFKPISLIRCVYKVVTKILTNRLAMDITNLKKKQAMIFKVDFAKAYDSIRWDYLLDVLHAFGFDPNWCKWIRGDCMARKSAWSDIIHKSHHRLSKWKVKTLSIGGRLTLLKSVLGAIPLYNMSIYKVPIVHFSSLWCSILRETYALISKGFNFISHCKKRIGDGRSTRFWYDPWVSVQPLHVMFPHIFSFRTNKDAMVGSKLGHLSVDVSFRRPVRDGVERQQWSELCEILDPVILSSSKDRWTSDLNSDGKFHVKEVRSLLDNIFLPSANVPTRWVKFISIKINIFPWRAA
nr:RNA-directed DNA polymerase, eukaryota, reverse transcriptase zinc-binding domain protein [Tanacetum cinerariifolium]